MSVCVWGGGLVCGCNQCVKKLCSKKKIIYMYYTQFQTCVENFNAFVCYSTVYMLCVCNNYVIYDV